MIITGGGIHIPGAPLSGGGGAPLINFASFFTGVLQSVQSDIGITQAGGIVSAWADQSGNGKDYSQAVAGLRPTLTAGVNGFPGLLFDGVDDTLDCATLNLPSPSVTPTARMAVFRAITHGALKTFFGTLSSAYALAQLQNNVQPEIDLYAGSIVLPDSTLPLNTWGACESVYTGSISDYQRLGSGAPVNGTSAGTLTGNGVQIGNAASTGGRFASFELLAVLYTNNVPTAPQIAAWRAAVAAKYGGTVAV